MERKPSAESGSESDFSYFSDASNSSSSQSYISDASETEIEDLDDAYEWSTKETVNSLADSSQDNTSQDTVQNVSILQVSQTKHESPSDQSLESGGTDENTENILINEMNKENDTSDEDEEFIVLHIQEPISMEDVIAEEDIEHVESCVTETTISVEENVLVKELFPVDNHALVGKDVSMEKLVPSEASVMIEEPVLDYKNCIEKWEAKFRNEKSLINNVANPMEHGEDLSKKKVTTSSTGSNKSTQIVKTRNNNKQIEKQDSEEDECDKDDEVWESTPSDSNTISSSEHKTRLLMWETKLKEGHSSLPRTQRKSLDLLGSLEDKKNIFQSQKFRLDEINSKKKKKQSKKPEETNVHLKPVDNKPNLALEEEKPESKYGAELQNLNIAKDDGRPKKASRESLQTVGSIKDKKKFLFEPKKNAPAAKAEPVITTDRPSLAEKRREMEAALAASDAVKTRNVSLSGEDLQRSTLTRRKWQNMENKKEDPICESDHSRAGSTVNKLTRNASLQAAEWETRHQKRVERNVAPPKVRNMTLDSDSIESLGLDGLKDIELEQLAFELSSPKTRALQSRTQSSSDSEESITAQSLEIPQEDSIVFDKTDVLAETFVSTRLDDSVDLLEGPQSLDDGFIIEEDSFSENTPTHYKCHATKVNKVSTNLHENNDPRLSTDTEEYFTADNSDDHSDDNIEFQADQAMSFQLEM